MDKIRILALSDEVNKALWDFYKPSMLEDVDLIISCGDLPYDYLTFLATVFRGPVLYVHGNHDDSYKYKPPEGCICIDDEIFVYKGIRIFGLGGCHQYSGGDWQYSQKEMDKRIRKLWFKLKRSKGFDILVTHSPAYKLGDGRDRPHQGFKAFIDLIDRYKPLLFLFGHIHLNYGDYPRKFMYHTTLCINAFGYYYIHLDVPSR